VVDLDYNALCREEQWFRRDTIFEPTCAHDWPCTEGQFVPVNDTAFVSARSGKKTSLYNATVRGWYKSAVKNGAMNGGCLKKYPECRQRPGWGSIYLSKSSGVLVLPSVFPLYAGTTQNVRAVITLCLGLKFLDDFIEQSVRRVSTEAQAWIVDLNPATGKLGGLIASSPKGFSTRADSESVSGVIKPTMAVEAKAAGSAAAHIQEVSQALVAKWGGWLGLPSPPDTATMTMEDGRLIQAKRIQDPYGLEWLIVLSVPEKVFVGDLPRVRNITIIVSCSMTVVLGGVLLCLTQVLSNHLVKLGRQMAGVAALNFEDNGGTKSSVYSEISWMQGSFTAMSGQLKQFWTEEQSRLEKLEREKSTRIRTLIQEAVMEAHKLKHPMVVCCASVFMQLGALVSYENLRDTGKLVILDTMEKVEAFRQKHLVVFISHQWLGWGAPDPNGDHHKAIVNSIKQVQESVMHPNGGRKVPMNEIYIWVDFSCISQEHRGMQMLAIASLPVYSSVAHAFLVVAPTATHKGSGEVCDLNSYNTRGWCRTETISKVCGSGVHHMYIKESVDGDLVPVTLEVVKEKLPMKVFDGTFSCCGMGHKDQPYCDKQHLVLPILGLYATMLHKSKSRKDEVFDYIVKDKDGYFPKMFTFSREDGTSEERELFGELVGAMDARAKEEGLADLHPDMGFQPSGSEGGILPQSPNDTNGVAVWM
jgi:hypothetical protein